MFFFWERYLLAIFLHSSIIWFTGHLRSQMCLFGCVYFLNFCCNLWENHLQFVKDWEDWFQKEVCSKEWCAYFWVFYISAAGYQNPQKFVSDWKDWFLKALRWFQCCFSCQCSIVVGFHGSICHAIGDLHFFLLTPFEAISMKIFLQRPGHARSDSAGSLRMASHVSNIINFEQAYNKVWL